MDLAAGVRGAQGVGARHVEVDALGPGLHLELRAGAEPPRERAQRRQRARQLRPQQRAARRIAEVDDVVRAPRVKAERPRRAPPSAWRDRGSRSRAGRAHRRDGHAQRPLDDGALGRPLRVDGDVLPLAAAAAAEEGARRRRRGRGPARSMATSSAQATRPLARSIRARTRSPGAASGTKVARPSLALSAPAGSRWRPTASPPMARPSISTMTSRVPAPAIGYGKGWAERPRARSKSMKPASSPPIGRMVGGVVPFSIAFDDLGIADDRCRRWRECGLRS